MESMDRDHSLDSLQETAGREAVGGLSPGSGDDRSQASQRSGSSAGLASLQRPDSRWPDDQPHRPDNLELATYSEQAIHAREVLGKCGQKGEKNNNAKLSDANAELIRIRRENGEDLKSIARDFMISDKTVSKIALRQRWACIG
jgi:hypothetical protein